MADTTKVAFTKEKATMLITLYGRALQSRSPRPILRDTWAEEAIHLIDYDFAGFKVGLRSASLVASRAAQLDRWTARFLAENPTATVLHLGCGLDSRYFRIAPSPNVSWFDIDYPDVIELRQKIYHERPGYRMIGSPLADLDWLQAVPKDRPGLIIAEGVTMYLTEDVLKALLQAVTGHFRSGQVAFDVHPLKLIRWMAKKKKSIRGTGAIFHFGVENPGDITRLEPRLELLEDLKAYRLAGYPRMPWTLRLLVRLMNFNPALRIMRCLLFRF